ncbi:MAG: xanthine dehydrogenase family protein molybdopterin-binding subunit, partial [Sphingobacteriales bacterium]
TYVKMEHATDLTKNISKARTPTGPRFEDYTRGEADAYTKAAVKIEQEYYHPIEVHSPMEPGSVIAMWQGKDKVTVYTKTQGVEATQRSVADAFKLPPENITVNAEHVGGAFGMGLRTWPYEIAGIMGAQKIGRPLKLMLHREQMFTNVGHRPETMQKIGLGASADGKLVGISHEATAETSAYEEFTEATVNLSRFLYACPNVTTRYKLGAEKIGWKNRKLEPKASKEGDWLIGYGMGTGAFGAFRGAATIKAILYANGTLILQCSVNDMGPGTATMMTTVAANTLGMPVDKIKVEMGSTSLPPGPMQGGSTVTSTVGAAVHDTCIALKEKIATLAGNDSAGSLPYADLLKKNNLPFLEITKESKGQNQPYSMYSFSVHFVKLRVHQPTGRIKIDHVVSCADAGTIVNQKTAASQMMGGAVGGLGMALMEDLVIDHRFGRAINNNLADYHVPVNADIPAVDVLFVNKKDPYTNPMGSKGLGEIALVGVAPAVANAVFNATGKRIRSLPITLDKLL